MNKTKAGISHLIQPRNESIQDYSKPTCFTSSIFKTKQLSLLMTSFQKYSLGFAQRVNVSKINKFHI